MPSPTPFLDHLVLLLPHQTLTSLPPFLTSAFQILPGGRHADNLTENKLIILADGVYLELIAFLPQTTPAQRQSHKWGNAKEGTFVDWALSLHGATAEGTDQTAEERFRVIQDRVREGNHLVEYADPIPGGRIKQDGTEVKWAVSQARHPHQNRDGNGSTGGKEELVEPGVLPFWCLDRTPRELRVPSHVAGDVVQPCGAIGVAKMSVEVPSREIRFVYSLIQGNEGVQDDEEKVWQMSVPVPGDNDIDRMLGISVGEGSRQKLHLTLQTENESSKDRRVGGELADGVELWIELRSKRGTYG